MQARLLLVLALFTGTLFAADRAALHNEIIQVERAFNQYCLDHGRPAGWMAFITDEAYLMNRNTLGRAEAQASFVREEKDTSVLTWEPSYADASLSGDLGYSWGIWKVTGTGPDGHPAQRRGIYLTVWRRQADGRWKFVFDGGRPLPEVTIAAIHQSLQEHPAADYAVPAAQSDRARLERELWDLDVAFSNESLARGAHEAFLAHLADEALLLDRGVRTKAAAAQKMATEPDNSKLSWAPLHIEMAAAGDLALVWGEWLSQETDANGKSTEATGVYSAVWKRQRDQTWKIVFDNGRPYPREIIASLKQRLAARAAFK